ncbi:hypothetical protein BLA29_007154 [Euroglyphus maynei]|uniref:Uncharacterized protein n=1 Tax=Euroglyphus maynei TaxID=6958 RepID=A0A1Y3BS13_EURMA|nr:hypothetical protein BLA29_007154 [Euroglyphus maynei]
MLLRSNNKLDCNKDVCIFNVKGFAVQRRNNFTRMMSDEQQNLYHFEINAKTMPRMKMARLYFKTSISSLLNNARQQQHQMQSNENIVACFTIDYIVKANNQPKLDDCTY